MPDYVGWIRSRIGNSPIQLNFAAACVVTDEGVLLRQRGDDGAWGFPGGAIELGESAAETAVRETEEETGLRVRADTLLGVHTKYRHSYPGYAAVNGEDFTGQNLASARTSRLRFTGCSFIGADLWSPGHSGSE
ncbi:NUDIX domain-containing protein [Streptomyces europaeiscabiei]|uniref:NUDIX domain-containing protein n=1 Tax=Streptomyces europaeiscabiei TaxID=146819 RepID=UPI0029B683EE|nr:NUDIX domain-containing protein [Streptomyces europaeiscabiei]MDX3690087.1 NUDIX domain-containing protein [Streptomyces europaeiscabiei]